MHAKHADSNRLNDLSGHVMGCAFMGLNSLGAGFPERVNENALVFEPRAEVVYISQQFGTRVYGRDVVVDQYFVDLAIEDLLLIESKTAKALGDADQMQCIDHLKATGLRLCLPLNFGKSRLEIKRVAHGL